MSSDTKLSKFQLPKKIWLGAFRGKTFGNLGKKVWLNLAVYLVKGVLPKLATNATLSVIDKLERK